MQVRIYLIYPRELTQSCSGKLNSAASISARQPLLVEIEEHATVSKLKKFVKKEMGYGFPITLLISWKWVSALVWVKTWFWRGISTNPSSELGFEAQRNQRLHPVRSFRWIVGTFLLAARKHVHIIVERPLTISIHFELCFASLLQNLDTPGGPGTISPFFVPLGRYHFFISFQYSNIYDQLTSILSK